MSNHIVSSRPAALFAAAAVLATAGAAAQGVVVLSNDFNQTGSTVASSNNTNPAVFDRAFNLSRPTDSGNLFGEGPRTSTSTSPTPTWAGSTARPLRTRPPTWARTT